MTNKSRDTVSITRADREKLHQHKSIILWFTGLSGSGKSTLAHAVDESIQKVVGLLKQRGRIQKTI